MPYIVIALAFGLAGGIVGKVKGSSFFIWFMISALIPVIGLLTALFYRFETKEPRQQCPGCRRLLPISDAICHHCGTEQVFPEVPISSEDAVRRELRAG
jgi:hypothetical protein